MVGAKVIKIVFSLEFRAGTCPQDLWPFLISETGNPASPVNWTHVERPPVSFRCLTRTSRSIGTLRSEDGDGSENIALKVNSRSFKLHHDSSNSPTLSNVGELSWSWIPKSRIQFQKEKENFVVACLRPLYNVKLGIFTL